MAGRFVVQSTGPPVLPPPTTISSSILNPSERAYCTTRFHSSTQCSRTRLHPWNSRFSFLAYSLPLIPLAPLSVRVRHFPSTSNFYRAGINPRCRLRLILQLSLIQRIPWNVIITTVYLELLLSLSAFYTATRGEPWVSSVSRELPRIVFKRKGCNNRSCTVRWIMMRDKLTLMMDDYSGSAIM